MSNHSDFEYISQWYGANGARCAAAAAFINAAAGLAGSDRTREPVPAWRHSDSSDSRIVPKRSAPTLKTAAPGLARCADTHLGEIVGVDELVAIGPVAEHEDVGTVGYPFEQDPEDAEPAVTKDGARPDDGDVEALRSRLEARPFGGELGVTVGLDRGGHRAGKHGIAGRYAEHRARRRVHELADTRLHRFLQQQVGAVDVDRTQQRFVLRQRYLGDVVEHDVDAGHRASHDMAIPNVADDQLDIRRTLVRVVEIQHTHAMAGLYQPLHEQRSEVPAAPGDEAHRRPLTARCPPATHQRMLRRMPS